MSKCFEESDLRHLETEMVQGFDRRVAAIPKDLCAPFNAEARQLESELLFIYRIVVLTNAKEDNLSHIATAWNGMVRICDESAKRLAELVTQHPYCGADSYYDRVLDLRNKCLRLQEMHS